MLPYSGVVKWLRDILIVILAAIVLWRLLPRKRQNLQLWVYLAVLGGSFAIIQNVLKRSGNAGYPVPLIFQFAVVFHYWSWYTFSFSRLRSGSKRFNESNTRQIYERILSYLRQPYYFTLTVVALNLVSVAGVLWYYRLGETGFRYLFDYSYFLYFLVFHVTFSFRPRLRRFASAQ